MSEACRKVEKALEDSVRTFRAVVESSHSGLAILDEPRSATLPTGRPS